MDDVVRAATIEIQQKDQEFLVSDNFDVDSNKNSNKTHFAYFEDHNNDRIAESEKVALDRLVMDDDEQRDTAQETQTQHATPSAPPTAPAPNTTQKRSFQSRCSGLVSCG